MRRLPNWRKCSGLYSRGSEASPCCTAALRIHVELTEGKEGLGGGKVLHIDYTGGEARSHIIVAKVLGNSPVVGMTKSSRRQGDIRLWWCYNENPMVRDWLQSRGCASLNTIEKVTSDLAMWYAGGANFVKYHVTPSDYSPVVGTTSSSRRQGSATYLLWVCFQKGPISLWGTGNTVQEVFKAGSALGYAKEARMLYIKNDLMPKKPENKAWPSYAKVQDWGDDWKNEFKSDKEEGQNGWDGKQENSWKEKSWDKEKSWKQDGALEEREEPVSPGDEESGQEDDEETEQKQELLTNMGLSDHRPHNKVIVLRADDPKMQVVRVTKNKKKPELLLLTDIFTQTPELKTNFGVVKNIFPKGTCKFHPMGTCNKGDDCAFKHAYDAADTVKVSMGEWGRNIAEVLRGKVLIKDVVASLPGASGPLAEKASSSKKPAEKGDKGKGKKGDNGKKGGEAPSTAREAKLPRAVGELSNLAKAKGRRARRVKAKTATRKRRARTTTIGAATAGAVAPGTRAGSQNSHARRT